MTERITDESWIEALYHNWHALKQERGFALGRRVNDGRLIITKVLESWNRRCGQSWADDDRQLYVISSKYAPKPVAVTNGFVRPWVPSNKRFLGPPWVSPQTASRSVQPLCTARQYAQHTDTQTTLRVTSVVICRIHAMHAMRPKTVSRYAKSSGTEATCKAYKPVYAAFHSCATRWNGSDRKHAVTAQCDILYGASCIRAKWTERTQEAS